MRAQWLSPHDANVILSVSVLIGWGVSDERTRVPFPSWPFAPSPNVNTFPSSAKPTKNIYDLLGIEENIFTCYSNSLSTTTRNLNNFAGNALNEGRCFHRIWNISETELAAFRLATSQQSPRFCATRSNEWQLHKFAINNTWLKFSHPLQMPCGSSRTTHCKTVHCRSSDAEFSEYQWRQQCLIVPNRCRPKQTLPL